MTMEAMDPDILCLLHRLGITANYTGFFHTARAIRLCAEEPDRLLLVRLYPEQGSEVRLPQLRGGGKLYLCCSRHGLFEVKLP